MTSTSTSVKFTESLNGTSQRYAEFIRDAATNGNLTKVIPGRRSATCALSGATGCQTFAWNASHRPTTIRDPRSTGADTQALAVSYFGTSPFDVQSLAKSSGGTLLKVLSYDVVGGPPSGQTRVRWQDADGTATGTNGYARHTDLSPNGSVLTEWAPSACASAACASGGAATDREATFASDGIDQTTTETRYRLPGSAAPITTRRGTLAAARVDNYADPLTAGLTAWTQSPDQAAASTSTTPGAPGFFATTFTYTDDGDVATTSTPHANPAGGDPIQTVATTYDEEGHPVQVDDNRFLTDAGFEAGGVGWALASATPDPTTSTHDPTTSRTSMKLTSGGTATQAVQLLPGQTVRFQLWGKAASGATLTAALRYWDIPSSSWPLLPGGTITTTSTSWAQLAYDVTMSLPVGTTDGQLRIGFSSSGTTWVDDVVVMTSFGSTAYSTEGLPLATKDILDRRTAWQYDMGTSHPAIFATRTIRNDVTSISDPTTDEVTSTSTFDAWGRALVETDPDGVATTTAFAANKTDIASVADGLGNATQYLYDEIGQQRSVETALHRITTTNYDWFGNPFEVQTPDGTGPIARSTGSAARPRSSATGSRRAPRPPATSTSRRPSRAMPGAGSRARSRMLVASPRRPYRPMTSRPTWSPRPSTRTAPRPVRAW